MVDIRNGHKGLEDSWNKILKSNCILKSLELLTNDAKSLGMSINSVQMSGLV